jgi:hypothetical protein
MATVSFVILQLVVFFAPIYIYLRKNLWPRYAPWQKWT